MDARPLVHHYARCGSSRLLVALCDEQLKRRGQEPYLVFWRAYGSAREGNFAAALRDCESLRGRRDSEYAALVAAAYYHRNSKLVDRDALANVEAALQGLYARQHL